MSDDLTTEGLPADLAAVRRAYTKAPLDLHSLSVVEREDPVRAVERWVQEAVAVSGELEPTAMVLATAEQGDQLPLPDARVVLCKGVDTGLLFFTNRRSTKGRQLAEVPIAAAVFHWASLERQLRVRGVVRELDDVESDAYWRTRPRGSQIAAWSSVQSAPIATRDELGDVATVTTMRFHEADVPRPPWWGGYRLEPTEVELWQGGEDRLHDRLLAMRHELAWSWQRLQP